MAIFRKTLPALGLVAVACAYDGFGERYFAGTLNDNPPLGLSATEFQQSLSQANATGIFPITGYSLSLPQVETTADWTLQVHVKADVPLTNSDDDDVDKSKFTQLSVLSIEAPDSSILETVDSAWRVCAVIYPGLNDGATGKGQEDEGDCKTALSDACVTDLEREASSSQSDRSGSCGSVSIPESCREFFPKQNSNVGFELNKKILDGKHFYALSSSPTNANDEAAYAQAVTNIWPVIITWDNKPQTGSQVTTSQVRCLRASRIADGSESVDSVPTRGDLDSPTLTTTSPPGPTTSKSDAGTRSSSAFPAALLAMAATFLAFA